MNEQFTNVDNECFAFSHIRKWFLYVESQVSEILKKYAIENHIRSSYNEQAE
jgi:hypothetical protein